ncbi:hypothetical protein [Hypericibacter sp.]|uniref:hypothetical protein n=1 Tax=Hypericibacter sp. TaxID=2705401 RepID=UPI003D6CFC8F
MPDSGVLESPKHTRGTGGSSVRSTFAPLPNSGAAALEPLEIAIDDWIETHAREFYEVYALSIGQTEPEGISIALDFLKAIRNLTTQNTIGALDRFEQYTSPGWDGDDAEPLLLSDLKFARGLLRQLASHANPPDAAPGPDGSICMEWVAGSRHSPRKIFLDVGPGDRVLTYAKFGKRAPVERHFKKSDFELVGYLQSLFGELSKSESDA